MAEFYEPGIFVKKPIKVEAMRVPSRDQGNYEYVRDFGYLVGWLFMVHEANALIGEDGAIIIQTSEGEMTAEPGDWIIREPFATDDRTFYPCKPDIFEQTYEALTKACLL